MKKLLLTLLLTCSPHSWILSADQKQTNHTPSSIPFGLHLLLMAAELRSEYAQQPTTPTIMPAIALNIPNTPPLVTACTPAHDDENDSQHDSDELFIDNDRDNKETYLTLPTLSLKKYNTIRIDQTKKYYCPDPDCQQTGTPYELTQHCINDHIEQTQNPKTYSCSLCLKKFNPPYITSNTVHITRHIQGCHTCEKSLICNFTIHNERKCKFNTNSKYIMLNHQTKVHASTHIHNKQTIGTYTLNDNATQQPTNLPTQTAPFSSTSSQSTMLQLISFQTAAVPCAFDTLPATNSNLSPHNSQANIHTLNNNETHSHNTPTLPNNSQPIEKISNYQKTKKGINQQTIYQCGVQDCSATGTPSELTTHHLTQHTYTGSNTTESNRSHIYYECLACKETIRAYNHKGKISEHIRSNHTYDKPFKCSFCSYCSIIPGHIKTHHLTQHPQHQSQQALPVKENDMQKLTQLNSNNIDPFSHIPMPIPINEPIKIFQASNQSEETYNPSSYNTQLYQLIEQFPQQSLHLLHTIVPMPTPINTSIKICQTSHDAPDEMPEEIYDRSAYYSQLHQLIKKFPPKNTPYIPNASEEIDENIHNNEKPSSFKPKRAKYDNL